MEIVKSALFPVREEQEKIRAYIRFIVPEYGFIIPEKELENYSKDEKEVLNLFQQGKQEEGTEIIKKIIVKWEKCSLRYYPEVFNHIQQIPFHFIAQSGTLVN